MISSIVKHVNLSGLGEKVRALRTRLYPRKVMFVHVPKSGGTSLSHMLRAKYLLSFAKISEEASTSACQQMSKDQWFEFKRCLAAYHAESGIGYIQGHFCIDKNFLEAYQGRYRIVTLLRHPVDRLISHYYFDDRYSKVSLEEFVKTPVAYSEAHVLCHFFGDMKWEQPTEDTNMEAAVSTAISNLRRLSVVGVLDKEDDFVEACRRELGISLALPKRNVGVARNASSSRISEQLLNEITQLCRDDLRIYEYALQASANHGLDANESERENRHVKTKNGDQNVVKPY
ncbi:sulfotransferase family 2 domain-containing protein [Granulosicoccus sp. 3-233]|uniref:sulfotransferase family 2 domain-containing protein n=1 Tax=Granulosicoccus sp. 3-233 TaxID=3417969 RepID=UPI003D33DD4C